VSPSEKAAITVPSAFRPEQRAAIEIAAVRAGLSRVQLIDEPHAAAVPYSGRLASGQLAFVYDLGGGTFDAAVLRATSGGFELLAAGGDAYLGGDDIDLRCAEWAAQRILAMHSWDVRSNEKSFESLLFACERAKVRLSDTEETLLPLAQVDEALEGKDLRIDRAQLEKLYLDLMQRTFVHCDDVVGRAGISPRDVSAVILAGGGTYIPAIRAGVEHYFGCEPMAEIAPDRVVAIGAAQYAAT
jgi:molecular chaperone DnaK